MKTTTTSINPTVEFPKVEKMLYDLAWKFVQKYPQLSFEDAKSQAYWGFMISCRDYDPKRGMKFSSHVYFCTWIWLKNLIMDESKSRETPTEINEELVGAENAQTSNVHDLVADLPNDCKEIVHLLCEVPADLLGMEMTPKQFLRKIKDHAIEELGYTKRRWTEACQLLQQRVREA